LWRTRAERRRAIAGVASREPPSITTISSHQAALSSAWAICAASSWQTMVQVMVGPRSPVAAARPRSFRCWAASVRSTQRRRSARPAVPR
jgi:hypothetical protein